MQLKKGTILTVEIKYLNISGRGIAEVEIENEPYFLAVDDLYPGDVAEVTLSKIKKKYLEGKLVKLITKSPHRTKPRSKHAEYSGGSPWEILDYAYQLQIKQTEVERILTNIEEPASKVKPILGMEDPWFYRNKMQYSFGYDSEMNPVLGLHVKGRKFDVYDLEECFLCEPWIPQVISEFRKLLDHFSPYRFNAGTGELRDLSIKVGKNTGQKMAVVSVSANADLPKLISILKTINSFDSLFIEVVTTQRGTPTKFELHKVSGSDFITEKIGEQTFQIGPHTFFQPNTTQATKIFEQVAAYAAPTNKIIYDLFCGSGTIGITLAPQAKHIYGIDIVEESIKNAIQNVAINNLDNCTYIAGDVFKDFGLHNWPAPDVIVLDPPRAGLSPGLVEFICTLKPAKIVYVSCNIKSFTQDLVEFKKHGWNLSQIQPIDQFPHTKHLEVVAELTK